MERKILSAAATGRGRLWARGRHSHTPREMRAPLRLHVGVGEEKFVLHLVPPSGGARHTHMTDATSRDWSLSVLQSSVVDFCVPRSAEEQEMETPHPTGENGLAAEEE